MDYKKEYSRWLTFDGMETSLRAEMLTMSDQNKEASFGKQLAFGTGGLRGIMGAGTNRMNIYTVRQATKGFANYISSLGEDAKKRGVVIAHDSRNQGEAFAEATALSLCAAGITAYIFDELRPTPELSFAVRYLGAIAGINITASHNPKEYNGYKAYFEDGAQLAGELADKVQAEMQKVDPLTVAVMDKETALSAGLYKVIGKEIDEAYLAAVLAEKLPLTDISEEAKNLKVVYTPFHGTGYRLVPEVLQRLNISVVPVEAQMTPDGDFPTLRSPNPEEKDGFAMGVAVAKEVGADLILATDPDADRVGVGCLDENGEICLLNGNQIGLLLTNFIINRLKEAGQLPKDPAVVTTIVSSRMTEKICLSQNVSYFECLTGFKYIGEYIAKFEQSGSNSYIFGFEESYGCLKGSYARDKDAVVAVMMIAQMAIYYKNRQMTLPQAMEELYKKYGYYDEKTVSVVIGGTDPNARMGELMAALRADLPKEIAGNKVEEITDILQGYSVDAAGNKTDIALPKSDVLRFCFGDGSTVIIRPSGTEPKVKLYVLTRGNSLADCKEKIELYAAAFGDLLK